MATVLLQDPAMRDAGVIVERDARNQPHRDLPAGTRVVSADNHLEIAEDIFFENFPAHLRDNAPRVWFDVFWRIGYRDGIQALPTGSNLIETMARVNLACVGDVSAHLAAMDEEGIDLSICFPQTLIAFARYPDLEVQENMYRVFNEYQAERCRATKGRINPVAVFSNWWDPDKAEGAMRQIVDLGFKTFMVPCTAGKGRDGKELHYGDPHFDRFWSVANHAGLPVCYHVGEGADLEHRGGLGSTNMVLMAPFRKPFGQILFGGVFDRNPKLQVVFAEGGISWVPPALQDAEALVDSFGNGDTIDRLDRRPSEYWHEHCHASFQNDRLGLGQLDILGPERVMWATDYPHSEGSYGYGRASMASVVELAGEERARGILGGNAIRTFGLDG